MASPTPITSDLKSRGIQFEQKSHECLGFHGTSRVNADGILANGFTFDIANSNAFLGVAIYFYDNAPYAGAWCAECWARYGASFSDPIVLQAGLEFLLLLDLFEADNATNFWKLFKLLRAGDPDEVDERFVAYFIGTRIAPEMGSEGISWKFPVQEPHQAGGSGRKEQIGFAVKKLCVIKAVCICDDIDRHRQV